MKRKLTLLLALLLAGAILIGALVLTRPTDDSPAAQLSPKKPQVLTLWHYYNGRHQQAFDRLVMDFNETQGAKLGIVIEARSQGSVGDLTRKLLASARGDFGADPMPDLFAAYADMAWDVSQVRPLADLNAYFTKEELSEYISSYIEEGRLAGSDALSVFPVAKSTEVLMLNRTEWDRFYEATGTDISLLSTWEGLAQASRMYYEWTDGLTPDVPRDGRAFFGMDSPANYLIIGSQQMGVELFSVQDGKGVITVDEAVMRRLWDAFMAPYVNGWYASYGAYRTDDIRTGRLAAALGSTSGTVYFPAAVTRQDGSSYPIEGECLPVPTFAGAPACTVQQGAGMAVTASTPVREYAASVFLKWFTEEQNNIEFSVAAGYLPVKSAANRAEPLRHAMDDANIPAMQQDGLLTSAEMTRTYTLYTSPVFDGCYEARMVLETSLINAARNALSQRDQLIAAGLSQEEAIARLTGDDAFATWISDFRTDLFNTMK